MINQIILFILDKSIYFYKNNLASRHLYKINAST